MFEQIEYGRMRSLLEEAIYHACECNRSYEDNVLMLHSIGFNPYEIACFMRDYDNEDGHSSLTSICEVIAKHHNESVPKWVGKVYVEKGETRYMLTLENNAYIQFAINDDMNYISNDDDWYWIDQFACELWKRYGDSNA